MLVAEEAESAGLALDQLLEHKEVGTHSEDITALKETIFLTASLLREVVDIYVIRAETTQAAYSRLRVLVRLISAYSADIQELHSGSCNEVSWTELCGAVLDESGQPLYKLFRLYKLFLRGLSLEVTG